MYLAGLFVCCMFCHGELASLKPAPKYLTTYYLMIALGGAVGGLLVGLAAPYLLTGYFELAIGLIGCSLLLLFRTFRMAWWAMLSSAAWWPPPPGALASRSITRSQSRAR
jgi:hypothetical protein